MDLLTVRSRHGLEGRVTLFHGSGRSAAGRAGEPPGTEGAGCPKLLSKLNGSLIVLGLPAQPKATTGCVALRLRHYVLRFIDRTPEEAGFVCECLAAGLGRQRSLGWEEGRKLATVQNPGMRDSFVAEGGLVRRPHWLAGKSTACLRLRGAAGSTKTKRSHFFIRHRIYLSWCPCQLTTTETGGTSMRSQRSLVVEIRLYIFGQTVSW